MQTLITLDYEVFFGRHSGSVRRCLIEPTQALVDIADRRGVKLVFFVDAGYILRLREELSRSPHLRSEYDAVCRQVEALARAGHEIQLHIHSHWEDTHWGEDGWQTDVRRYALQSFDDAAIHDIVARYTGVLRELAGPQAAFAYRAGGWVIQPFRPLRDALLGQGVTIDSTVFAGGLRKGQVQPFDFRGAPKKSSWRFDDDPLVEVPDGPFREVPIASIRLGPDFFWRFALRKKLGGDRHRAFGDGRALPMEGGDLARKLLLPSVSVASIDGYKASFLDRAAAQYQARGMKDFVVIGHPKAFTPYSLGKLDEFLGGRGATAPCVGTFSTYLESTPIFQKALAA